jgi:glutathione synthase/RimK-type ligase-like ATP-grasp enzyme
VPVAEHLVLVEKPADWKPEFPEVRVAAARDYIASPEFSSRRDLRVLNLCRSYRYLSVGYYCSLLAEARRHKVLPTVRTINDLSRKSIYSLDFADLDTVVSRKLKGVKEPLATALEMDVFFGHCTHPEMADLARQLFEVFRMPLLRAEFRLQGKWRLAAVKPLHLQTLEPAQEEAFLQGLSNHLKRRWTERRARPQHRYDIAILHNPEEELPPSDTPALRKFVKAGERLGLSVDLIEKKDYGRLAEYDALFIRETTGVNHHTYQFAKRAETEGIVVIDDPDSILRCTNKVYLAELLRTRNVPMPTSAIVRRGALDELEREIPYPVVIKIPDSSFSRGVFKADDSSELKSIAAELFKTSDLLLAQEFVYTPFDWRIGVLSGRPLFACQYFMTDRHWQIIKHDAKGRYKEGDWKTVSVEEVPEAVTEAALAAANLLGDGLFGVDVKDDDGRIMVMEVNENPNIETEVEDAVLGDRLYEIIIEDLVRRIEARRGLQDAVGAPGRRQP